MYEIKNFFIWSCDEIIAGISRPRYHSGLGDVFDTNSEISRIYMYIVYILQYMYIHIWYVNAHKREAHTETTPYGY